MQTMILGSAQSTFGQRGKRTRKGKQPVQDDQPRPEFGFRTSWVRALPKNCNRVIRDLFQLHFVKNNVTYLFWKNCVWPTLSCFLMQIFVPACHSGHFVMLVVDCLQKVFYFFYSLPSATHRVSAPILVNTCFSFQFSC